MGRMTISETLPVIAIVGPTGTGKSALAIELALRLNGECINADSMQFYRGMDIGTAKVTAEEMRGVPHHLLDIMDVRDEASVAEFQERSRELIEQIRGRGRYPILVGGSGLYVRAALDSWSFPARMRGCASALRSRRVPRALVFCTPAWRRLIRSRLRA